MLVFLASVKLHNPLLPRCLFEHFGALSVCEMERPEPPCLKCNAVGEDLELNLQRWMTLAIAVPPDVH